MNAALRHIAPVIAPIAVPALVLAGCAGPAAETASGDAAPFHPVYKGIETALLDGDLVQFRVRMAGARDEADVAAYAECAAAEYALIRGYGFARHVRTNVERTGSDWRGDAVYVISDALPEGLRTIDAEVTVAACRENGIPTI
ncbi:MAG: hypothetical protein D6801_05995 [Alphaproteobacteria bacterium]|nr:MAG: hypothetical protein D6801_05995 [Alphaproteobacteria bacterium]